MGFCIIGVKTFIDLYIDFRRAESLEDFKINLQNVKFILLLGPWALFPTLFGYNNMCS